MSAMLDHSLLQNVLRMTKTAYVPPGPPPTDPSAMGGMPMDPSMMGGAPPMGPAAMGGAPPMDPSMMGGMPMDPSMMGGAPPMDPSMMGGMPPMDPSMMGGDPPPMDPSMVGGLPPEGGMSPGGDLGMPVILNMQDLQAILQQAGGGGGDEQPDADGTPKRVTNKALAERIDELEMMLAAIMNAQGIPLPEMAVPTERSNVPSEGGGFGPIPPPEDPIQPEAPAVPEGGLMAGLAALGGPPPSMTKMASLRSAKSNALMAALRSMNTYT